jgi:three-Cys-motif partner protein
LSNGKTKGYDTDVLKYDRIGYWSEVKLDIIRKYAQAYSTIMAKQGRFSHVYIDGFAGTGEHISKNTGEFIPGSPLNALAVQPPFSEYHLVDLDSAKAENLRSLTAGQSNVHIYDGDCNKVLRKDIFLRTRYEDYRRALCILDPYGLHLDWEVMYDAGRMKSIEIFLNFPIMDMNMNVLKRNPENADDSQVARMNSFWGDTSWRDAAYSTEGLLFGEEKTDNEAVANAFRDRLRKVADFAYVPDPMPMRNSKGAIVYYLFFASQNTTGAKIVTDIFSTYRDRRDL